MSKTYSYFTFFQTATLIFFLSLNLRPEIAQAYEPMTTAPDPESQVLFESLSPENQNKFRENQVFALQKMEKILKQTKWTYGVGFLVKDTFQFIKETVSEEDEISPEIREMMREQEYSPDSAPKIPYATRTQNFNLAILAKLDKFLWSRSPKISATNEFGLFGSLNIQAVGGIGDKGWGRHLEIGISLAVDKNSGAIVFQIFHITEKFKNSFLGKIPVLALGVGFAAKIGGIASITEAPRTVSGNVFYPPNIPGFVQETETSLALGPSSGLPTPLYFPPSPIGDMVTYLTELDKTTWLKLSFSSSNRFFVNVSSGVISLENLKGLKDFALKIAGRKSALSCTHALSM